MYRCDVYEKVMIIIPLISLPTPFMNNELISNPSHDCGGGIHTHCLSFDAVVMRGDGVRSHLHSCGVNGVLGPWRYAELTQQASQAANPIVLNDNELA